MSALTDAEAALAAAQSTYSTAQAVALTAAAEVATLEAEIAAGSGSVTSDDLAAAKQNATFTAMAAEAALTPLPALSAAVQSAQADATVTAIETELVSLGVTLESALATLASELPAVVAAIQAYDAYVTTAKAQLSSLGLVSPRVDWPSTGFPFLDHKYALKVSQGAGQIAAVLLPFMVQIGAPQSYLSDLKLLAMSAPTIPTS